MELNAKKIFDRVVRNNTDNEISVDRVKHHFD